MLSDTLSPAISRSLPIGRTVVPPKKSLSASRKAYFALSGFQLHPLLLSDKRHRKLFGRSQNCETKDILSEIKGILHVIDMNQDTPHTSSAPDLPFAGSTPHIMLVADDITGACDSATHFAQHGLPARLLLRGAHRCEPVLTLCISTRNATDDQASAALRRTLDAIPASWHEQALFFLKLDSAARGPIAASILAAAEILQPEVILYAPAFPALQRTVDQGVLRICDIAGQQTLISLRDLFLSSVHSRITIIPAGSQPTLRQAMLQALDDGRNILLCDSISTNDLNMLAQTVSSLSLKALWVGSGGLASALAEALSPHKAAPTQPPLPAGPALLICGTNHPVTMLQLHALQGQHTTAESAHIIQIDWQQTMPAEIRAYVAQHQPAILILTGGDTAAFVLDALDADSVLLCRELAPGIPLGRITGGLADGCNVITKSGGFGDESALLNIFNLCTGAAA
jgi:D-threonate/D-erythronate kinase